MSNHADYKPNGNIAPLKNVATLLALATRLIERPRHLDGLGVFSGPSGFGKSWAAIYLENKLDAKIVEVKETWTRLTFLKAVLQELGVHQPKGMLDTLAEKAVQILSRPGHPPLVIDEADKIVDKGFVDIVRQLHMDSRAPIIMIGEEELPDKLALFERTHNRVLGWELAQPCDVEDAAVLASLYLPRGLRVEDDLLAQIVAWSQGRARRICNNLDNVQEWARIRGAKVADLANYDGAIDRGSHPIRQSEEGPRPLKKAAISLRRAS